jgi:hypothetical protein
MFLSRLYFHNRSSFNRIMHSDSPIIWHQYWNRFDHQAKSLFGRSSAVIRTPERTHLPGGDKSYKHDLTRCINIIETLPSLAVAFGEKNLGTMEGMAWALAVFQLVGKTERWGFNLVIRLITIIRTFESSSLSMQFLILHLW